LRELIDSWEVNSKLFKDSKVEFLNLEGSIVSESDGCEKNYSIQIGNASWIGVSSIIVIINDITHVKNYYKILNVHKDQLLATVSHELRTPLNGMLAMLDLSIEEVKNHQSVKEKLEIVNNSGRLLLNMINDILDMSMLGRGKLRLNYENVHVKNLIDDCFKLLAVQSAPKGINLIFIDNIKNDANRIIRTDGNRLRQILTNLIGNATKFTRQGSVTVRISEEVEPNFYSVFHSHVDPQNIENNSANISLEEFNINYNEKSIKQGILIEVIDTGIGIKPEHIASLFKLFGRLSQEDNNVNKHGVGLGLAISQSLVRSLNGQLPGGEIKVESEEGKGSRFFFPLFITNFESSIINLERRWGNSRHISPFPNKSFILRRKKQFSSFNDGDPESAFLVCKKILKKILVVDDDQINLLVANSYLRTFEDYDIILRTAINGSEAVEIVCGDNEAGEPFDIILMDCNMPIMDGFEASRILKKKMSMGLISYAPIVAITANVGLADKEKCLEAGMDEFLSKPYKKIDLLTKIRKFS
jgi:signal transduction histidine kinase